MAHCAGCLADSVVTGESIDSGRAKPSIAGTSQIFKAGIVRTNLGRPGGGADAIEQAKQLLAGGKGILNTARACGLGTAAA
jgi:hypothetical protein